MEGWAHTGRVLGTYSGVVLIRATRSRADNPPPCVTPRGLPPDLTAIGNCGNPAAQPVTDPHPVTDPSVTRGPIRNTALPTVTSLTSMGVWGLPQMGV
jgi:hypothetical protein